MEQDGYSRGTESASPAMFLNPPYNFGVSLRSPNPTLSILEGNWTFDIALERVSHLCRSAEEHYEISFPGKSDYPRNGIKLSGSKAADKTIRFQNGETGTFAFAVSLTGRGGCGRKMRATLPSGIWLGQAEQRNSSSNDKIFDKSCCRKFVTKTLRHTKPQIVVIKDAISREVFAHIEERNDSLVDFRIVIRNSKTSSVQKALFLGYAILRLKRKHDPSTSLHLLAVSSVYEPWSA